MPGVDQRSRAQATWRVLLALLCVVLVFVAGTAQVAHTHADGVDTHADCSLCAAAHVTVTLAQTPAPAPTVSVVAVLEALPAPVVPSVLSTFALFTRPPPVANIVPA
jgi:hypothetical protein